MATWSNLVWLFFWRYFNLESKFLAAAIWGVSGFFVAFHRITWDLLCNG